MLKSTQDAEARPANNGRPSPIRFEWLWIYASLAGSLLLRFSLFDFESGDYLIFFRRWHDFFLEHGRWSGLATINQGTSNYPPLYLYFFALSTLLPISPVCQVKLISVLWDYATGWYVWKIARAQFPRGRIAWGAVTVFLFLPTVVMNGALWAQCDVMYTAALVASLYHMLAGRPVAALVAFGVSASLKPQAIFFGPFLAGLVLRGVIPWRKLWVPIAVYAACGVPQILAGRPVLETLGHWMTAEAYGYGLTLGATNWYQWVFEQKPEVFWGGGVVLTLVATGFIVLWMLEGPPKGLTEKQWLAGMALLSLLFPPFFLPGMHERYFCAADVFAVIYAFYLPRGWVVMLLIQFGSAFTYLPYLFHQEPIPRWSLSLAVLAAMGLVIRELLGQAMGNKPESECPGQTPC